MSEWDASHASSAELTATERQLLDYLGDGLFDAEIAVRMGLSTGDVKARLERLAVTLGVEGRDALRTGRSPSQEEAAKALQPAEFQHAPPPRKLPRLSPGFGAVVVFAAGLAVGLWLAEDGGAAPAVTSTSVSEPTHAPPVQMQGARIEVIDGREMVWTGRLFYSGGADPLVDASNREALAAARLSGPGYMALHTGWTDWRSSGGVNVLNGTVEGLDFELFYQRGDESTGFLTGPGDYVGIYSANAGASPTVLLYAFGPDGKRHHLHITAGGDVYIDLTPISPAVAIDSSTGEALPTSALARPGSLPIEQEAWAINICVPGPCIVSRHAPFAGESAPLSGHVTCPDDDQVIPTGWEREFPREGEILTLDAGDIRLHFWRQAGIVGGFPPKPLSCPAVADVQAGDPLLPSGRYLVFVSSRSGEPLDVVVDGLGNLSVGKIERQFGCPCVSGS